jgi:NADH dehydrogenase FAD-containing subunit
LLTFVFEWAARLVLALGAEAKIDVVPGSAEYALPFTTLEDALVSTNHLMKLYIYSLQTNLLLELLILTCKIDYCNK